ncbi:MAG: ferritin-like domain-containing protein [Parvibaculales bacterium]
MHDFHATLHAAFLCSDPVTKAELTQTACAAWKTGKIQRPHQAALDWQDRPGRPEKPDLCAPNAMPRRRYKGLKGRIGLLHALAHIELNAIDLALDLLGRFTTAPFPDKFIDDWMAVAQDESKHFLMINKRLEDLGSFYGALPAHDGLWEAAYKTKHDLAARLAVVPLVLEARGLDVTPGMIEKLERGGDVKSAELLEVIFQDEKTHVRAGVDWFLDLCKQQKQHPEEVFRDKVATYFDGILKPPFNIAARNEAGLPENFYQS